MMLGGARNPVTNPFKNFHASHAYYALPSAGGQQVFGAYETYARPNTLRTLANRFQNYQLWSGNTAATMVLTGTDGRNVAQKISTGRTVTDCLQELGRTIQGTSWVPPVDNKWEFLTGDQIRPIASSFTIALEADDDSSVQQSWARGAVDNPTRQTIAWTGGEATYSDPNLELIERRDGGSLDTMVSSQVDALALAAYYVARGLDLGLRKLWAALLNLVPGTRFTVSGLPGAVIGFTARDMHVLGWKATYGVDLALFELNSWPADTPAEIVMDDVIYGHMDFSGGDALTTTAMTTGSTTVTIATTDLPLTVAAGDYPLYLTIDGEDLLIPAAPASAVTPQVLTSISRAQRGTVAAAHSIGALVYVTPPATFAP